MLHCSIVLFLRMKFKKNICDRPHFFIYFLFIYLFILMLLGYSRYFKEDLGKVYRLNGIRFLLLLLLLLLCTRYVIRMFPMAICHSDLSEIFFEWESFLPLVVKSKTWPNHGNYSFGSNIFNSNHCNHIHDLAFF